MWLLVDSPGEIIPTGVAGGTILTVSTPSANVIRYTSATAGAFDNVVLGDYVVVWSQDIVLGNRIEGRVYAKTSTTLDVLITASEYALVAPIVGVLFTEGFVVLRSTSTPQKFKITSGIKTLDQIAQNYNLKLIV